MNKLYLVWFDENKKVLNQIGTLSYNNGKYIFVYDNQDKNDLQLFSSFGLFPGFIDINQIYQSDVLFPTIQSRLPSKNREDYLQLLREYKLDENSNDFEILQSTKGKLSSDNFLFITPDEYNNLIENIRKEL